MNYIIKRTFRKVLETQNVRELMVNIYLGDIKLNNNIPTRNYKIV